MSNTPGTIKMRDLFVLEGYVKELSLLTTVMESPRDIALLVRKIETIVNKIIGDTEYEH